MLKHVFTLGLLALLAFSFPGCAESEPELPPEPAAPPPPTAAEIQREIVAAVQPVVNDMQQKVPLDLTASESHLTNVRSAVSKHRGTENAPEAFNTVASQLKDYVRQADRAAQPWYVVFFYDALTVIDQRSAADVTRLREQAQLLIDRPKPQVRGFFKDEGTGQTTVFLEIFLPKTNETHSLRAREGDEFHNLRLVEIIGDNKCVKFEYLVNQDTFQVCTEAARQSL